MKNMKQNVMSVDDLICTTPIKRSFIHRFPSYEFLYLHIMKSFKHLTTAEHTTAVNKCHKIFPNFSKARNN